MKTPHDERGGKGIKINQQALLVCRYLDFQCAAMASHVLSTGFVCQSRCGPGAVPRLTRSLGRVILALPSVCLGGPPFQACLLLLMISVSDEKHDKRKGTPCVGPERSSAGTRAERPDARCPLEEGGRLASHHRPASQPAWPWPRWPGDGRSASRSKLCAETAGYPFLALGRCSFGLLARHMLHRAGGNLMMPGLLESFL